MKKNDKTQKMRFRKTPMSQRSTYTYFNADGTTTTLVPGVDGITEEHIKMLHAMDDAEVYSNVKNSRPKKTEAEKAADAEWECQHPGEKAPVLYNASLDYIIEGEDDEYSLEDVIGNSDDNSAEVEILHMAIETLNERQKRIYELHYLQGFTLKEVAAVLGLSAPTVTGYKQRIEKIIKKFFDDANFSV